MPIEIKELHIKINVKGGDQKPQEAATDGNEKLLQECLEQVTTMLNKQDER